MRKILALGIVVSFAFCALKAQADPTVAGAWTGALDYPGGPCLPLVLHITGTSPNLAATLDEPSQGVHESPVSSIVVTGNAVVISINNPQISNVIFRGTLAGGTIAGSWSQGGGNLPTTFRSNGESACSPDVAGTWIGTLYPPGGRALAVALHISGVSPNLSATVDSPNSGIFGSPVNDIAVKGHAISFSVNNAQIANGQYAGTLGGGTITGSWSQGGGSLPLSFVKGP